ncbi:MAG: hypothetical protein HC927_13580 [Deltaproteobacteria bacterium]|nr:hypothetical protein [Deltaproteobacteria bacterium]
MDRGRRLMPTSPMTSTPMPSISEVIIRSKRASVPRELIPVEYQAPNSSEAGAISKTVNVPTDATVDEIHDLYVAAWRLGIKAVAVYRDGSKRTQPLGTSKDESTKKDVPRAQRRRLEPERASITHKFAVGGHEGYITVGFFPDGTPGEIFITMSKEGSTISGLMDTIATSISLALQYGVPLRVMVDRFSHMRFEPAGFTGNPNIPMAKSVVDYIFRWLGHKFLRSDDAVDSSLSQRQEQALAARSSRRSRWRCRCPRGSARPMSFRARFTCVSPTRRPAPRAARSRCARGAAIFARTAAPRRAAADLRE